MGAWSHEPFGNDTSCDWAYGLEDAKDLQYIEETLDRVIFMGEDYVDASDAEEAVAAAEVVAKLLGRGTQSDSYTKTTDEWVSSIGAQPSPALKNKAKQALQRILADDSELRELWEETDEAGDWRESIERLIAAIGG